MVVSELIFISLFIFGVVSGRNLTDIELFSEHISSVSVNRYPCKEPQPRFFQLRELINDEMYERYYKKYIKSIRPYGTVLHRCEFSGCCVIFNQTCRAKEEKLSILTFYNAVRDQYFQIKASNNTMCACY
ncbi:uncharacterized protein LOC130441118 [Diorhabda sublineata]|uniref:uncharacterized protein LOC130441118 n=1 Tax=Diorhabda sublineata TaxID=1163346 RepID=UPI0024E0663F|nr:uncharacterized protein LOC130441118 [Diorhabda sublineata]